MFKAVMSDAKLLKDIIVAIATLIDEGTFEITSEAINLREMDPSRVAMVDFQWSKSLFDEYDCSQPTKICINITEMLKLLKRAGKGDSVELTLDEERRRLNIK
ncbi:DNA polymerase sliding clamp, partial [Candidatus Bathyarchaeota archaeon]